MRLRIARAVKDHVETSVLASVKRSALRFSAFFLPVAVLEEVLTRDAVHALAFGLAFCGGALLIAAQLVSPGTDRTATSDTVALIGLVAVLGGVVFQAIVDVKPVARDVVYSLGFVAWLADGSPSNGTRRNDAEHDRGRLPPPEELNVTAPGARSGDRALS